jgi:hypothetical protein
VGTALVAVQLARNPKLAVPPGEIAPFQLTLLAVTAAPACVVAAFQLLVICWPLLKVQVTVQLLVAARPVLRTVTSPWNPPVQWFVIW